MELEKSLGNDGQYNGLYGEVVTCDMYRMRDVADIVSINDPNYIHEKGHASLVNFIPDVIIDLGANVGVFSRYARTLFPKAIIISVEPDPVNCSVFREHTNDSNTILLENAIGHGDIYNVSKSGNGAMKVYLSEGLGYSKTDLKTFHPTDIKSIMLTDLKKYIKEGDKTILKLDIEGNETVLFNDPASVEMLKTFNYITIELHYYACDGGKAQAVTDKTNEVLNELSKTHNTLKDGVYFYAVKNDTV